MLVRGGAKGLSGGTTVANPEPLWGSYFGTSLAAGDFTGDGKADLAVVAQGSSSPAWKIPLVRGPFSKSGARGKLTSHSSPLDRPSITAGRVTKDALTDLVVQGQRINGDTLVSSVSYKGASTGLVKGAALPPGDAAAIGDLDKDGYADLTVAAPQETDDAGGLTYLRGARGTAFPAAGSLGFGPGSLGRSQAYSDFGGALAG